MARVTWVLSKKQCERNVFAEGTICRTWSITSGTDSPCVEPGRKLGWMPSSANSHLSISTLRCVTKTVGRTPKPSRIERNSQMQYSDAQSMSVVMQNRGSLISDPSQAPGVARPWLSVDSHFPIAFPGDSRGILLGQRFVSWEVLLPIARSRGRSCFDQFKQI